MNTDAPLEKAKAALRMPPAHETANFIDGKHSLAQTQASLTIPIPSTVTPADFPLWQAQAAAMAREARRTQQPRHYRALLAHCAGMGLRVAMVAALSECGSSAGGVELLANTTSEGDSRPCSRCHIPVTNANLGGHDERSAFSGRVWCTSCADGGGR